MDQNAVRRDALARAYANNQGSSVAFIDESYAAPGFAYRFAGAPFYILAAYVIPVTDLGAMRGEIEDVVGGTYWHSTESHRTGEGQQTIRGFTRYLGYGSEPVIVTLRRPVEERDTDGEIARAACMRALLVALAGGEHCERISLAIFEERKYATQRNADETIVKNAKSDGLIPRHMHVMPMSPSIERLLWLPDVASFALYQHHAGIRSDYAQPFHGRVIEIRA